MLDDVFADHRRVQGSAAAGENNATDIAQFRGGHFEAAEFRAAIIAAQPAAHRVAHRSRLLKDLLEHVMREVALLDVLIGELDFAQRVITGAVTRNRADLEPIRRHRDDVEVVQVNCVARVGDDGADVAREEVFVFANSEHER